MEDLKKLKKQSIYLIIMSFLVIGVLTSYALGAFDAILQGARVSTVSTCSLDIDFVDTNPVTLLSGIPIDDVDAEDYEPYIVTVKNNEGSNCKNIRYTLSMTNFCSSCEKTNGSCTIGSNTCNCNSGYQIDSSMIKYSLKNVETGEVITGIDPYSELKLSGTLESANEVDTYEIKLWISNSATNSDIYVSNGNGGYLENSDGSYVTKDFCSKIKLDVNNQPIFDTEGTLAYAILGRDKSNVVSSGDGLYVSTATNDGSPTYYYKGAVENNYVSFAGQTWRVVRINEDGTIRLIMEEGFTTTYFNINFYDNYKYMYYSESNVAEGAMKRLNDWYQDNLSAYNSKIATSTYCEQAKVHYSLGSTAGNVTMVSAHTYVPSFECQNDANGYGLITNQKIGFASIDEVMMAGIPLYTGSQTNNPNVYLTGDVMWLTMSPAGMNSTTAAIWRVAVDGYVYLVNVSGTMQLGSYRPVINLNADTFVTGSGTSGDMWVVQ